MSWQDLVLELAARAPEWMRARASADLEVAVLEARLETPVLDLSELDGEAAVHALTFFLCVCLASGARVARVCCGHRPAGELARRAKSSLGRSIVRIEDENAPLMGYFDVHLCDPATIGTSAAAALVRRLRRAIEAKPDGPAGP